MLVIHMIQMEVLWRHSVVVNASVSVLGNNRPSHLTYQLHVLVDLHFFATIGFHRNVFLPYRLDESYFTKALR